MGRDWVLFFFYFSNASLNSLAALCHSGTLHTVRGHWMAQDCIDPSLLKVIAISCKCDTRSSWCSTSVLMHYKFPFRGISSTAHTHLPYLAAATGEQSWTWREYEQQVSVTTRSILQSQFWWRAARRQPFGRRRVIELPVTDFCSLTPAEKDR